MVTPYEAHLNGASAARALAAKCLEEAKTAGVARAFYLIAEADRHTERADWYEQRERYYQ